MKVTVIYTGRNDLIVHAATCRDVQRDAGTGPMAHGTETIFADSQAQVAAVVYSGQLHDAGVTDVTEESARSYVFALDVKPCVKLPEVTS